ncbi:hypothetical protein FGE12_20825 [Aggregicoccus sp. 17bor-14]|uniref:hypothetical protein n=1 Tax=Myxococcaceae TaxID=31 RepID=UPI00129C341A|nr:MULTISPECIES: hypothetical protein [Myxococcaceae]MBF5044856.1 hypothetical protein [Simulacricoccus sp. 17bor-14]MRI90600.1 hypothetical protein [Aggregicoccus sp. 17bor-14]
MRRHAGLGLAALWLGLAGGCTRALVPSARDVARAELQQTAERVYPEPPAALWPRVEAYFRAQGYQVREPADAAHASPWLQTDYREVRVERTYRARARYHARVQPREGGGSELRIYRQTVTDSDTWQLLLPAQQLTVGEQPEQNEAADALLPPEDPRFAQNFFRDLSAERALQAWLQGGSAAAARGAGGMPLAAPLVQSVAVELSSDASAPRAFAADAVEARCGPAIPGLVDGFDHALRPGGFLLLGQVPGTREVPAFVGQAVCHILHAGTPVVLALELPVREQPALERYLASEGTDADRAALVHGPFWRRPEQDGRSSEALVALVERMRLLNRQGLPVTLLAFSVEGLEGNAFEEAMAAVLAARRKLESESSLVVLTGNVHASTEPGVPWDKAFVPMGALLAKSGAPLRSFDLMHGGGSTWECRVAGEGAKLSCGTHLVRPIVLSEAYGEQTRTQFGVQRDHEQVPRLAYRWQQLVRKYGDQRPLFVHMAPDRFPRGFDGYFYVPHVSASPPARHPGS